MGLTSNHYEALGLPITATAEQIKRKYRELARLYHPDVNSSPEAAQRILAVNQAYRVIGDPERRAQYDAERSSRAYVPKASRTASQSTVHPRARRPANPPPTAKNRVYYDGFGRNFTSPPSDRRPAGKADNGQKRMPDTQYTTIDQVLAEAKLAFINRQFPRSLRLCQDALKMNPREPVAHEILGDIFTRQGDVQRASTAFGYAIQFNPRNQGAQAKLTRLLRVANDSSNGPAITYTRRGGNSPTEFRTSEFSLIAYSMIAGGTLVAAPILLMLFPGTSTTDALGMFFGLSYNLFAALGVAGAAGGILLAFYGRMRPFTEEMWNRSRFDGSNTPVPLGAILALFSVVCFYGSFLVYIGISAIRNRFSPSILRAYGATLSLVFLFTLVYHPPAPYPGWIAAAWGGNILFPSVLFGWLFGDALRLRGRM